jgi:4-methyl-5(b-hydroxyethyl)-thiazole monophosphate biosynthesis
MNTHSRKQIGVVLATGFEEIEAVSVIDVLRRADLEVHVLGVDRERVEGAHGLTVQTDRILSERDIGGAWDALVLPGGMPGASTLRDHLLVQQLLVCVHQRGAWVAAICAAPIALAKAGLLAGKRATCYPGFETYLAQHLAIIEGSKVVVDDRIITSRGVGTALAFSLELVARLRNENVARDLAGKMLIE